jgi:LEA14-like dessication related protein
MLHKSIYLIALLLILSVSNCAHLMNTLAIVNCDYTLVDVKPANIGITAMDLIMSFQVRNPNPVGVTITSISFDFIVNDKKVLDGVMSRRTFIPSNQAVIMEHIMKLNYFESGSVVIDLLRRGSANYRVVGTVYFETPLGILAYDLDVLKGKL